MPKVSFVVAIYGVAEYIGDCVRSLYGQTLEDIEIILADDCTPDGSIDIALRVLEEYPQRKEQVKVVRHEQNQGTKAVRKTGIMAATGEYVLNIDGDDWVDERMAELMYAKAVEEDADMVLCGLWWYRQGGKVARMPVPYEALGSSDAIKDATLDRLGWPNVWCRMVRRSIFLRKEMVWPVANHAEDVVVSMMTTYLAQRIACVREPLYHYRYNPNSITNVRDERNRLKKFDEFVRNNELLIHFYEQNGISERYRHGLKVNKNFARNELLPLTGKRKYRRLWIRTYPELNREMLRRGTYRERIWLAAVSLGLYPKWNKYLLSQRLRPAAVWRKGV
ncbi:MAG: glycosyltransferase family 2 protein [Bacteroidales bacterium]|nr:glycosyltransferase family 2 protein [Bacteroidales bacterium]